MKNKNVVKQTPSNYVVGIGASAGGLDAINALFENMPADSGLSFVILQHLSPDHKSLMVDLLSRHTTMRVFEAENGTVIMPNCIYLLPSKKMMTVKFGKLFLEEKDHMEVPNNVIDVFFESLGENYQSNAIGIILSGSGFDGTRGAESIKRNGGVMVVQDPATAAFDSMPESVIKKGLADIVLPPENIGSELIELINEEPHLKAFQLNAYRDEFVLREILMLIRKHTGLDFTSYKRPTLYRRMARRLVELNITRLKDYLDFLTYNPSETLVICNEFLINVTQFFRDPEAFEIIEKKVIPSILHGKKPGDVVKVWSVACCSGEEAYSLGILFHEYMQKHNLQDINLKIFATDIDKNSLEIASRGVYSKAIVNHISPQRLAKYFSVEGENYRISQDVRKMIVFSYHNIIKDPPFSRMDFISCRNMLIYLGPESQKEILKKLHFAINLDGFIMLGPSEHIGIVKHSVNETDKKWRIYNCVNKSRLADRDTVFSPLEGKMVSPSVQKPKVKNPMNHLSDLFRETLLEEHSIAGIYIDKNFEVKQALGNYKTYLDLPESGFNFNLLKLVVPELAIALSVGVRKAMKDDETQVLRNVNLKSKDGIRSVNLTIKPYIRQNEYQQQFIFIVISDNGKRPVESTGNNAIPTESEFNRITELELELKETRDNLQAVIEELETTNEELQSANEEMVSSNEELQSTNEELQSLNEELHTVSAEHQLKIKELMDLNDEMINYFNNSDIGQILIDRKLIIRKFSPAVRKMINLIDSDINRSIMDITTRFKNIDFIGDIKKVLEANAPMEKEIPMGDSWFLMRISPYLRQDRYTDGIVISFINISETKKLSSILEAVFNSSLSSIQAFKAIRNAQNEVIDFEYLAANHAAEDSMHLKGESLVGKRLKISFPDKGLDHFQLYKDVVDREKPVHYEYYSEKSDNWFDIAIVKMQDGIVVMETNITDKKKAADVIAQSYENLKVTSGELKTSNLKLERSNLDLLQFASVASHDLKEPLRKIETYGNLLMAKVKHKLEDSEYNNLNKIIVASNRMQRLIEDVLTFSKLSNTDLPMAPVNVNSVITHILEDLEITVKEKGAVITVDNLPVVEGITGQIHQLFQNLISNALKFQDGKVPEIKITAKSFNDGLLKSLKLNNADEFYCISVKDNGIGFEDAYKDKIFGIFQRLNGNNYVGTGIGLAICKKIVENHRGYILTESKVGEGAEFILLFPKKQQAPSNGNTNSEYLLGAPGPSQ